MKIYTPQEKQRIQRHPLFIRHSGNVPEELRHLVYPDEAKPEMEKKGKKAVAAPTEGDNGNGN